MLKNKVENPIEKSVEKSTEKPKKKTTNRNKLNIFLDLGLALVFVLEMERRFTGQLLHEILGLGFGLMFTIHLILHWQWVVTLTRTFFQKLIHETRFKYVINLLLFVSMLTMIVTGIVIARTLGYNLGQTGAGKFPWQRIHVLSGEFSIFLVGLHIATSWKWIATNFKKYLLSFNLPKLPKLSAKTAPVASEATSSKITSSEA